MNRARALSGCKKPQDKEDIHEESYEEFNFTVTSENSIMTNHHENSESNLADDL